MNKSGETRSRWKGLIVLLGTVSLFLLLPSCGQGVLLYSSDDIFNRYETRVLQPESGPTYTEKYDEIQTEPPSGNDSKNISDKTELVNAEIENESDDEEFAVKEKFESVAEVVEEPLGDPVTDSITVEVATEPSQVITHTTWDVSKTVYMTADVTVWTGPSEDYEQIGTLMKGTETAVTGVCEETGWYRFSYNGENGYFDSAYTADTVTSAQPKNEVGTEVTIESQTGTKYETVTVSSAEVQVEAPTERYVSGGFPLWNYGWHSGTYLGRLRVPSVGVDVAIYNNDLQTTIDAIDSAMFVYEFDIHDVSEPLGGTIYCGDHAYQGFDRIANCSIGDAMYIDGADGDTYKYVCDRIDYNGANTGRGLNDSNGNTLNYSGGVWCYTCHNDSDYYIYEVHFVPV